MDSPLVRLIASVLGGYVFILLLLLAHDWYREEYPSPPSEPAPARPLRNAFYHERAEDALERFRRLPEDEQRRFKKGLKVHLLSMAQWLHHLDRSDVRVLFVGECHEETTRRFLADAFFKGFPVDVLMLEATPRERERLTQRMEKGRAYFPLLGADILCVLRAVKAKNPDAAICGIEETDAQEEGDLGRPGSREAAIARNFWDRFQPGRRHVVLFGALHCTNDPSWLFGRLRNEADPPLKDRMINARVMEEHQDGALEAFVFFLDEIGLKRDAFVIPDTGALPPRLLKWFQALTRKILRKHHSLIVFRTR